MARLNELFDIEYGNKLDMNKMTAASPSDGVAFVGRKGSGQGIAGWVEPLPTVKPYPSGLLTVALGGSRLLSTYLQQRPFYTAQNVAVLCPKDPDMTPQGRLFYAMCIKANDFRYSAFGREANRTLGTLEVPDQVPSWAQKRAIPTGEGLRESVLPPVPLGDPRQWREFALGDLFDIRKGRRVTKADRGPGETRFIGATDKNNGITDFVDLEPIFPAGCVTVPYNGSVGFSFYQDQPFFASDDVSVLMPRAEEDADKFALLFVCTVIRRERFRYTYGYKWNLSRMRKSTLRLPTTPEQEPDWEWMSRYVQGVPLSAALCIDH